jgi:hypothetical protein
MDLDDLLDVSWAQFDALTARPPPQLPQRSGEEHQCGFDCPHVVADDSGSYTCRLTGVVFSQQVMNGPLDNRIWQSASYFPPGKRKRLARTVTPAELMYSTSSQVVHKLLDTKERRQAEEERLTKALRAAARRAPTLRHEEPCALVLLYRLMADVERCGAVTVTHVVNGKQMDAIASMLTTLFATVVAPYTKVDHRRPTDAYYAIAMCYLLATNVLGRKLHVPILANSLPEEKQLKHLGYSVTRMTMAKRYVLEAIKHYVSKV